MIPIAPEQQTKTFFFLSFGIEEVDSFFFPGLQKKETSCYCGVPFRRNRERPMISINFFSFGIDMTPRQITKILDVLVSHSRGPSP